MSSWETNLTIMLRVLIGDFNSPQKNTDAYLKRVLIAAGILVENEIKLANLYTFDINNITIVPDPIDMVDIVAQALIPLKASCILNQSDFQTALKQGISVRDGDSQINTAVSFGGYKDILQLGPCAAYAKLISQLHSAASSVVGGVVLGAYRQPGYVNNLSTVAFFYDDFALIANRGDRNNIFY